MSVEPLPHVDLVAVDIGNSFAKVGLFAAAELTARGTNELPMPQRTIEFPTRQGPDASLLGWLPQGAMRWHVSSINRTGSERLTEWIRSHRTVNDLRFLTRHDLPITVQVDEPDKVGLDRLAAAVAANVLRPANQPAIVVGAGSAVTVNLISADGTFQGGAILPGFRLAAEALYGGADFLPLATLQPNNEPPNALGKNTEDAIRSGLFWGAVGAVRELIRQLKATLPVAPSLFITGGDLRRLALVLDEQAHYMPHLTLSGIAIAAKSERDKKTTAERSPGS
jgi:type III pantothenate kinase